MATPEFPQALHPHPAHLVSGTDVSSLRGSPFPIVAIGASAGGLEAFGQVLDQIPDNTGMAFVLVQHLDPQHKSQLAELLKPFSSMPIVTVTDRMAIHPDTVYVMPANTSIVLEDGVFRLLARESGMHLPVDIFFLSLAKVQGSRAIGIVLSGNLSDGSLGIRAIKAECGITFAQNETTARFTAMPRNAVATGAVDFILSPQEIGRKLQVIAQHAYMSPGRARESVSETLLDGAAELKRIFALLKSATKVDFFHYRTANIQRRIGRRMMVLRQGSLAGYADYAEAHPAEIYELYKDLLISVTSFFRDPEVFVNVLKLLEPELNDRIPKSGPVRIWVPGCATGEELYTLAICLRELPGSSERPIPYQIFGTDIDELALEQARQGLYPETIQADLSPERLSRFFTRVESGYQIVKSVRETCIFARHDVTRDPPFSNLSLISCRNLLVYSNEALQGLILPAFHYALKANGLLLLGTGETVSPSQDLFAPADEQARIYRRTSVPVRFPLGMEQRFTAMLAPIYEGNASAVGPLDLQQKVDRVIRAKYSPNAVLVDSELQILQFRGQTEPYLTPRSGEATQNLLRIAHESLVVPLQRTIQAVSEKNTSTRELAVLLNPDEPPRSVLVEVVPVADTSQADRYFLVTFQPAETNEANENDGILLKDDPPGGSAHRLNQELLEVHEQLRSLSEGYKAHSDELWVANEEARSAIEELQSTNEELSITKEELQSTNEELTTVNEELEGRNAELSATNGDLKNLLSAVSLAIIMVDQDLCIRRFNASAEKMFGLTSLDHGQRVGNMHGDIQTPQLEQQIRTVIETLNSSTEETRARDGRWFSITIRPYRTLADRIAGAVIAIQDIDSLKRGIQAAEEARDFAEGIIKTVREPLVVLDADLRVLRATAAFYATFLVSREETEGRLLYQLGNGQWNQPLLRELLASALLRQQPFHDYEVKHHFPHIGRRTMRLNAQRIPLPDEKPRILLLAIEDTTERREMAEIRFQRLFETAKDGIVVVDTETNLVTDVNPYFLELTGTRLEDTLGRRLHEVCAFRNIDDLVGLISNLSERAILRLDDVSLEHRDGSLLDVEIVGNRYPVGTQEVVQLNIRDITGRKQAVRELQASEQRFRLFVDSVRDYALFQMDPEGIINTWTSGAERQLGWTEAEAVGKSAELVFTPEDIAAGAALHEILKARSEGRAEDERWHLRKDGSRFFASGVLTQVSNEHGDLRGFAKIMRDVTEGKLVEQRLKQQAALLDLAHDAILVRQVNGEILFWNRGAEMLYGFSASEAVGKISHSLFRTVFPEPLSVVDGKLVKEGHWDGLLQHYHQSGAPMTVASRWALQAGENDEPARVLEINVDVTETKEQEERLQRSLEEKSMLVREIHHRVKNNLQVIVSLLSLQANHIKDPQVVAAFEETESRVRAIAQIHERLYASDDLTEVEFAGYLTHLSQELVDLYATRPNAISLSLHLQEMVLHIEQAVPLGLIANELIINSLKHGLQGRSGDLEVSLNYMPDKVRTDLGETLDDGWARVCIRDSGPGLPPNLDLNSSRSLGFRLISLLVRQLRGELHVGAGPGAEIAIAFPLRQVAEPA